MELPAITLPKIDIPFDIPVLLHPAVDHFAIALPVVILLLELINLVARKRTISVLSLFLIILAVLAAAAAYFTGSVDGKEAFDALTAAGQDELKDHKLLGTYLMIASVLILIFKLLSMMIGRALMQAFYLLFLVVFIAGMLKQGKEGGELVYEHGANIEKVKILDEKVFDLEEALEEASPDTKVPADINQTDSNKTEAVPVEPAPATPEVSAPQAVPVAESIPSEAVEKTLSEGLKEEVKEGIVPEVKEAPTPEASVIKVEGMPEDVPHPHIDTH